MRYCNLVGCLEMAMNGEAGVPLSSARNWGMGQDSGFQSGSIGKLDSVWGARPSLSSSGLCWLSYLCQLRNTLEQSLPQLGKNLNKVAVPAFNYIIVSLSHCFHLLIKINLASICGVEEQLLGAFLQGQCYISTVALTQLRHCSILVKTLLCWWETFSLWHS